MKLLIQTTYLFDTMAILTCINHSMRPANKKCKICNDGLCKHCPARQTTNYNGDWDGVICPKCDGIEAKRGVTIICT